ncbi:MAG TPA: hypothetical protein VEB66_13400 [Opitutaceae bacterium]|nr:hypothetical protein [Opitutaceae bacterium]
MPTYTAKDWDEVRKKFRSSLMVDTNLTSLAQNLEGADWPVKGDDEKPSKYIEFTWEELLMLPEIAGKEDRVQHLVGILKETLSFDDPFGDMVAQVEETASKENPILKTLNRLNIPEAYPLKLVNLSEGTRVVCASEGVKTVGEFANLGQQMSTKVVLGGDFRTLLNVLTHGDEEGISQFLPYRKGTTGLHLAEALGLASAGLPRNEQLGLAKNYGAKLTPAEAAQAKPISGEQATKLESTVRLGIQAALEWFKDEKAALQKKMGEGVSLERYLVVIGDPAREAIAAKIAAPLLGVTSARAAAAPSAGEDDKKGGFFSRLFKKG